MSPSRSRVVLGAILLLLAIPTVAAARGGRPALSRATEGELFWRAAPEAPLEPAPTLSTDVLLRVTGMVVRARLRQEFTNPSREWAEGIHVFPLPEDAAVDTLKMQVGRRGGAPHRGARR
jgi:Ca-activated chloride channel family protein